MADIDGALLIKGWEHNRLLSNVDIYFFHLQTVLFSQKDPTSLNKNFDLKSHRMQTKMRERVVKKVRLTFSSNNLFRPSLFMTRALIDSFGTLRL